MPPLKWDDADEIGCQLHQADPKTDPLTVRFTELRRRVLALPEFADGPAASGEPVLERIHMAWLECFREKQA